MFSRHLDNHKPFGKSVLTSSLSISYLGFITDTVSGTLLLLEPKLVKVITACQDLLKFPKVSLWNIAHVTGLLVSAFPAVRYLELFHKSIEYCKSHQLHLGGEFDDCVSLSQQLGEARFKLDYFVGFCVMDNPSSSDESIVFLNPGLH